MSFSEDDRRAIAEAIATYVPEVALYGVTRGDDEAKDYSSIAKRHTGPVQDAYAFVARNLVDAYETTGRLRDLVDRLSERMIDEPRFLRAIAFVTAASLNDSREAMLVRRNSLISPEDLERISTEFFPRVCCIVGEFQSGQGTFEKYGTGFLVSPDLVLTARHVFEPLITTDPAMVPQHFEVVFDHRRKGQFARWGKVPTGARCVALATNWRLRDMPSIDDDGHIDVPTPQQIKVLQQSLDFLLFRLQEPVGLQPIDPSGTGRLRSWIDLPSRKAVLQIDSRITIPQHTGAGASMGIDFGRFKQQCPSGTRIRYNTESGPGASGAPCLDGDYALVGVHNAAFQPTGLPKPIANQAVLFDLIDPIIRADIQNSIAAATTGGIRRNRLWNVALPGEPVQPVIGRAPLLDWIAGSMSAVSERFQRLYAVVAPMEGAGKTFSIEILTRALAEHKRLRVIKLGVETQLLPTDLPSLVRVVGVGLGIPAAALDTMPPRPDANLPADAADGDKLRRWASIVVPTWFAGLMDLHRIDTLDRKAEAQAIIDDIEKLNARLGDDQRLPISNDLREQASGAPGERWTECWIAVDGLIETSMSPEVSDFIAALCGVGKDEAALTDGQRRLRWMFLGYRPDFLSSGDATLEILDPGSPPDSDLDVLTESILASGWITDTGKASTLASEMKTIARTVWQTPQIPPPIRMATLQALISSILSAVSGKKDAPAMIKVDG